MLGFGEFWYCFIVGLDLEGLEEICVDEDLLFCSCGLFVYGKVGWGVVEVWGVGCIFLECFG